MLYNGKYGKSTVSDEFNDLCFEYKIEATIHAYPNPGDYTKAARKIIFRNFNAESIKVIRSNNRAEMIPGKGTLEIMFSSDEPLPTFERVI